MAPRELLHAFSAVALAMRRQNEGEAPVGELHNSINGETMLMHAWDAAGVPYIKVRPAVMPLVDGRCTPTPSGNASRTWCLPGACKDCAPSRDGYDHKRFPECGVGCSSYETRLNVT